MIPDEIYSEGDWEVTQFWSKERKLRKRLELTPNEMLMEVLTNKALNEKSRKI